MSLPRTLSRAFAGLALAAACLAVNTAAPAAPPATTPPPNVLPGKAPPAAVTPSNLPAGYKGRPFSDQKYKGGAQKVPGTILCAYYDAGGDGIAYHGPAPEKIGSMNAASGDYYDAFRHREGVDISYTKYENNLDNSTYNTVTPPEKLLHVWNTIAGEWFNITVDAAAAGTYTVDILYASYADSEIALDINGKPLEQPLKLAASANPADPVGLRKWHHWTVAKSAAEVTLPKGKNLLTVHINVNGGLRLATLDLKPRPTTTTAPTANNPTTPPTPAPTPPPALP